MIEKKFFLSDIVYITLKRNLYTYPAYHQWDSESTARKNLKFGLKTWFYLPRYFRGHSDVGDNVMFVTLWWLQFQVAGE